MKLLYSLTSPYARKIRVVALEKHIEVELQLINLTDADCPINQHNPLGKIPVLVLDDESNLYDSRVIAEYLDHRTPVAKLIPQEHTYKIQVRRWEALADGVCDAAIMAMNEARRAEAKRDQAIIDKQMAKVVRGLKVLNDELGENKWCVGNALSLADIALGCVLGWIELRFADLNWKELNKNLAKHYAMMQKRPSFKETAPSKF